MAMLKTNGALSNVTVSSFFSVEKTLEKIVTTLMKNERLKRLLYYTDKHALSLPKLTNEQSKTLLNNQIKIIPKFEEDAEAIPYVVIQLENFYPLDGHPEFRSITLSIDIFCLYDHWLLDDFKLRPYAIAGEIDGMINTSYLNGERIATFVGARQLVLNSYIGGVSLTYLIETFSDDYDVKQHRQEVI